jgi:hypothetical protein
VKSTSLVFLLSCPILVHAQHAEIAGRSVEMMVVSKNDLSPQPWPSNPIELVTVPAIAGTSNVLRMIEDNGIMADSQALALVYDLNPGVSNLAALQAGRALKLPKIQGEGTHFLITSGNLIQLTVDPELRKDISQLSTSLQQFTPLDPKTTSDPSTGKELSQLIRWFGIIGSRFADRMDPPLTHETLVELKGEGQALNRILSQSTEQRRELTAAERGQAAAIDGDMKLIFKQFNESLSADIPNGADSFAVTVKITGGDSSTLERLRIYYECNGLFLTEKPFQSFREFTDSSSGTTQSIQRKFYEFWVAPDGNPNDLWSAPVLVPADAASPVPVTLHLKGGLSK